MHAAGRFRITDTSEGAARQVLGILFLFACLGALFGAYAFWPYFEREHGRLESWKVPLIWIGDATALTWFIYYFFEHFLLGRPIRSRPAQRGWALGLAGLFVGLACDLVITLVHRHDEWAAYQTAQHTQGQVISLRETRCGKLVRYDFACDFVDNQGIQHTALFSVRHDRGKWSPPPPPVVIGALQAGRMPFAMEISYDPTWPGRSWIRGAGWDDGDRLHYFSVLMLLFQVVTLPLFVISLYDCVKRKGILPWWHDLHKVFPLLIEIALLLLFGTIKLTVHGRSTAF